MDLGHLKTFLAVAETGSVSKASDRLRIAQPALSRKIRLLEAEIGTALFARHRWGMTPTAAGEALVARVSGILRQLDQSLADVRSLSGEVAGPVAFGIVPTVSYILAAQLAVRVAERTPNISLRIVEGYSGHLTEWLQQGQIDAAILYGSDVHNHMRVDELMLEELVVVGPQSSTLAPNRPLRFAEFSRLPLVLPSHPHGLRFVVETAAAKARVKLSVKFEADSFRVLKDLVEHGLGYTALPVSSIFREERKGELRYAPLISPKVTRRLILAMPSDLEPSRATSALVQMAREEIARLVRAGNWLANLRLSV